MIKELLILPFSLNVVNAFDYSDYTYDTYNYNSLLLVHTATNDRIIKSSSNFLLNPNGDLSINIDLSLSFPIDNSLANNPSTTAQYYFSNNTTFNLGSDIFNINYLSIYFDYQISYPYIEFDLNIETDQEYHFLENFININYGTTTPANSQVIVIDNSLIEINNLSDFALYGKDSYINSSEGQQQITNSIWDFFRNAIDTVLSVLNFNILPGIPLYLCVAIPVLFALLLWFIRLAGS